MEENIIENILELIKTKQINKLHQTLEDINSADFPMIFEELNDEDTMIVYRLLQKDKAADVFIELDSDIQEKLINAFTDTELKSVMDELFMDDTVDLIEEMPSNVVKRILKNIKSDDRKVINELLKFPEDSAGSIMTTELVELKEKMTVDEAFEMIRKTGIKKETIYIGYVVDSSRKLIGTVSIEDLLVAERNSKISEVLNDNVISVLTTEDQETVAKMFNKYNLMALPVVDKENRLVGIVTIDDVIDVIQDENTEDFEKMAAIIPNDDVYFKTGVFEHAKNRLLWLIVLILSSTFTGMVIEKYESAIAAIPLLVSFIPTIMDAGGNCGSQSSTLIIRGLALDEIKISDWLKAVWKELRVAILVGGTLAIITGIRIMVQYSGTYNDQAIKIALAVGLTLIATAVIAQILGCILPIIAKKLKLDPAIMASPLITTVVDLCSNYVFFLFATSILGI